MKIISSYVERLDEIVNGNFIKPSAILVCGTAATGKTTFGIQSQFNAAVPLLSNIIAVLIPQVFYRTYNGLKAGGVIQ